MRTTVANSTSLQQLTETFSVNVKKTLRYRHDLNQQSRQFEIPPSDCVVFESL